MTRDLRIAPGLDPRGTVLSTGEADPSRRSALGRMLTVRFTRDTVDVAILSRCQRDAAAGRYARAMAAYIRWLAAPGMLAATRAELRLLVERIAGAVRADPANRDVHPRHPAAVAELVAAYTLFLRFAGEAGGVPQRTAEASLATVRGGLIELMRDQAEAHRESDPACRFVALLKAGLGSERYHLQDADSDHAPEPFAAACGWHKDWLYQGNEQGQMLDWRIPPNSRRVGYIDLKERLVYLDPELAKEVAHTMGRAAGQPFEHAGNIARDLNEAKMIKTSVEAGKVRLTPHKRIRGVKDRYLTIRLDCLFGEAGGVED